MGVVAEDELLKATHGVNTQRGALFILGLLSAAAANVHRRRGEVLLPEVFACVRGAACGIVERELGGVKEPVTAGEKLYRAFGATGVRGEAEAGFPHVEREGLPALRRGVRGGVDAFRVVCGMRFSISCGEAEDTTVLWRGGPEGLSGLRALADEACRLGGLLTDAGREGVRKDRRLLPRAQVEPGRQRRSAVGHGWPATYGRTVRFPLRCARRAGGAGCVRGRSRERAKGCSKRKTSRSALGGKPLARLFL